MAPKNLPDENHVVRYVGFNKLRRDEDDNVIGIFPDAITLRLDLDERSLSVNWLEYFKDAEHRERDCIWSMRRHREVGKKSAFAIGNVGKIKETCQSFDVKVRILHEPTDEEPAHAAIRQLPANELVLLSALAEDAFDRIILNVQVEPEPVQS